MTKDLTKVGVNKSDLKKVHTEVLQEKDESEQKDERVQKVFQKIYRGIPEILVVIEAIIEEKI
jgi:hypothetical protein